MRATLEYEQNPGLRAEGPDGSLIFGTIADGGEGWRDRLCEPLIDAQIGMKLGARTIRERC